MYKHAMLKNLKDYSAIKKMQPLLETQIENTRWRLEKHGERTGADGLSRSRTIARMERTYRANMEFMADIDCCLQVLDERELTVIQHFYIDRTWDYIDILSDKLGVERSQLYRIKDKAMKKLILAYYGV